MMRRLLTILLLSLTLAACAAGQSVKRGDRAMAAGHYEAAFNAYRDAANRRPGNDKIQSKLEAAREAVMKKSLQDAEAAVEAREYQRAFDLMEKADAFSPEESVTGGLRERAARYAAEDSRARLQREDYWGAYDLAFFAGPLFGIDNDLIAEIRTATESAAGEAMGANDFPRAWDLYRMIVQFEPNQAPNYSGKVRSARDAWVAYLRKEAAAYREANDDGLAALTVSVADALEGKKSSMWSELATDLRGEHDLRFSWKTNGSRQIDGPTRNALAEVFGLSGSKPSLYVAASLKSGCDETVDTRIDTKNYLAGTRWVPNPQKQQLATQLGGPLEALFRHA